MTVTRFIRFVPALLWLPIVLKAGTYYIDFAGGSDSNPGTQAQPWKRVKGMVGCTGVCNSTILQGGDIVIFKGGVTWTGVFQWSVVGGASSMITYTTNHSWYAGASWSQPVFDDQATKTSGGMIHVASDYVTLNDLDIRNYDYLSSAGMNGKAVVITNADHFALTNCTLTTHTWISVWYYTTGIGSWSDLTFTGNDFSHTSNAVWVGTSASNQTISGVNMSNNVFHDFHDNMANGTHGNGLHVYGSSYTDATQSVEDIVFCGNQSYGDFSSSGPFVMNVSGGQMTALFFIEGAGSGLVCNNDFSFDVPQSSVNEFRNFIYLAVKGNLRGSDYEVYNNSLYGLVDSVYGPLVTEGISIDEGSAADHVIVKNNISIGMDTCFCAEDSSSISALQESDYNLWNCTNGNKLNTTYYRTSTAWGALGYDAHPSPSIWGDDPAWVDAPGDEHLTADSPAVGVGANLYSTFTTDAAGNPRPASGMWDMGAYQYESGTPPTITTTSPLREATVGVPYSLQFAATGDPATWTQTGIPDWAAFTEGGLLSGTPDAAGTTSISITATNGSGYDGPHLFTLTVNASPLPSTNLRVEGAGRMSGTGRLH